jgi:hypothetical protein
VKLPTRGVYPTDWKALAKIVKDEASWRCVRCQHEHCVPTGHVLTVHHFDGDKANCERWNLMALCQRCHLSVQGRVNPEIGLLTHPSVWAMPYIAGFYEAGRGVPSPSYDLAAWIEEHGEWPHWAPLPIGGVA